MQFYQDKDDDVWVVADDGTLLCLSSEEGVARQLAAMGGGFSVYGTELNYGPLIPLVPDPNRCASVLATSPRITCEYEKCDGGTHRAELANGTVVEWVTPS
jgi:hypothetical protein